MRVRIVKNLPLSESWGVQVGDIFDAWTQDGQTWITVHRGTDFMHVKLLEGEYECTS